MTEPLEDGRMELSWEARAGILDRDHDARAVRGCPYPDRCPGRSMGDGVGEQLMDDPFGLARI
jgi:hypothetical protein